MKKYLGLFVILALALVINVAKAEVKATQGTSIKVDAEENIKLSTPKLKMDGERAKKLMEMRKTNATWDIKTNTKREQAKASLDTLKAGIKNEKDANQAKIKKLRLGMREQALGRFDNVVKNLDGLEQKITSFTDSLSGKGVDVSVALGFVTTADTKLTDAKDKISQIDALLSTSIEELSADDKAKLKTLAQDTQTLLKDAQAALKDAVKSLKGKVKLGIDSLKETDKNKTPESTTGTQN
ncbi:MAG: hypothetical protein WCI76_00995 [bacterium]